MQKLNYESKIENFKMLGLAPYRKEKRLRSILGNRINSLVFQDIFFSILELSPKIYTEYLYSWGKYLGSESAKNSMDELNIGLYTGITSKLLALRLLKDEKYTKDIIKKNWEFYRLGTPSFTYVDEVAKTFKVKVDKSIEAVGLPRINKRVCFFSSAFLAGNVQQIVGGSINVFENKCIASGWKYCEFAGASNLPFHRFDVLNKSDFKKIKANILQRMLDSKEDEAIHLAIPQLFYLSLSLTSEGSHSMFYWIGRQTGKRFSAKLKGSKAVKMKRLSGLLKEMKIGLVSSNGNSITVKESAFSSGTGNLEKRVCSYLAGIFAGFLQGKSKKVVNVIETKCQANGDRHCEFKII